MPKRIAAILSVFLSVTLVWAGEAWKDKPYTDWNEKDVRRILSDSPWAKTIGVRAEWLRPGAEGLEVGVGTRIGEVPYDPTRDPMGVGAQSDIWRNQQARFTLRWASARTVRAALLRESVLSGRPSPLSADQQIDNEPAEFELVLVADPMIRFPRTTEAHLMENTYLGPKSSGKRMYPSRVDIYRNSDGRVISVSFFFPKTRRDRKPWLIQEETLVEFSCWVGGVLLRANFEPTKMANREGRDL